MSSRTALVVLAISDSPARKERTERHLSITQPYLDFLAKRMGGDLLVYHEKMRTGHRRLPAWQKLCIPDEVWKQYDYIVVMDNDILPHPRTDLEELLSVPSGRIGMVAIEKDTTRARNFYRDALALSDDELSGVSGTLNSGVMCWRTVGSDRIRNLFDELYQEGIEHMTEQTCLAHAIQHRDLHHELPSKYNTVYYKQLNPLFRNPRLRTIIERFPCGDEMLARHDRNAVNRCLSSPCFIHFVGSRYEQQLKYAADQVTLADTIK